MDSLRRSLVQDVGEIVSSRLGPGAAQELLRLGEAAGCVGRGLPPSFAAALPRRSYEAAREMPLDRCPCPSLTHIGYFRLHATSAVSVADPKAVDASNIRWMPSWN